MVNRYLPHFIYFVHQHTPCCLKIGITCDLRRRLREIYRGNPNNLSFLGAIACHNRSSAEYIETWFKEKYKKYKVDGEWFAVSLSEVNEIGFLLDIMERTQTSSHIAVISALRREL